ncbi:MAG: 50S ribosomal protein L4 [Candidatus Hydrogenedentes bacterium]|nr:50S ribosomal protein L4 [Candidatus Hydrogenedentota bacterium]
MATVKKVTMDGAEGAAIELADAVFNVDVNETLVQEAVVALRAAKRQGNHKVKTRTEVSGGGAKPFRQKGTGRARQGSSREPHMRGGGTVHGPVPRSYRQSVPVRVRRKALCCVLSARLRAEKLRVLEGLKVESPKTKPMAKMIDKVAADMRKTLLVTAENDAKLLLSTRNIARLTVRAAADLNVLDVLNAVQVVVAEEAIAKLEARLS